MNHVTSDFFEQNVLACVMVAIVDYYIRANHSITGKGNHIVYTKVVSL